jgi:DNA adenine methylase
MKLFPYSGAKTWLAPTLVEILERLRPDVVVSPFLGAGCIEYAFARQRPQTPVLGCDANAALIGVHKAYAADRELLKAAALSLPPRLSREEFAALKASYAAMTEASLDFGKAAEFLRFMANCFSGRYGSYVVTPRKSVPVRALGTPCPQNISVECRDAFELLRNPPAGRVAWYLDPPYFVRTTHYRGTSNRGFQHAELADLLHEVGGLWVLSYNDCPEIRDLYKDCATVTVERPSTVLKGRDGGGVELLIFSPEAAEVLTGEA